MLWCMEFVNVCHMVSRLLFMQHFDPFCMLHSEILWFLTDFEASYLRQSQWLLLRKCLWFRSWQFGRGLQGTTTTGFRSTTRAVLWQVVRRNPVAATSLLRTVSWFSFLGWNMLQFTMIFIGIGAIGAILQGCLRTNKNDARGFAVVNPWTIFPTWTGNLVLASRNAWCSVESFHSTVSCTKCMFYATWDARREGKRETKATVFHSRPLFPLKRSMIWNHQHQLLFHIGMLGDDIQEFLHFLWGVVGNVVSATSCGVGNPAKSFRHHSAPGWSGRVFRAEVFLCLYWTKCGCDRPLRSHLSTSLGAYMWFSVPRKGVSMIFMERLCHCLRGGGSYCSLSCKFFNCVVLIKDIHSAGAAWWCMM